LAIKMPPDEELEAIADRLEAIADLLDDLIVDRIRTALSFVSEGEEPDPALLAEEKRLARARRSVSKAVAILKPPPSESA
jgi:restriction endonuclease S subunit